MIIDQMISPKSLVLSGFLAAVIGLKAMAQSSSCETKQTEHSKRIALSDVPVLDEMNGQAWIVAASPGEVTTRFIQLFWRSPDVAQTIPCLPPLGDWTGNRISSGFGWRNHPTLRTIRHHDGIDIAGPHQYVRAVATGRVKAVGYSKSLGRYVRVDHLNSYSTVYGHLAMVLVHSGQDLRIGETLGITGRSGRATGVHLHYSVLKDNVPVDPTRYLTLAIDVVRTYQQLSPRTAVRQHP